MILICLLEMVARVGINGFGRIGRVIFRTCMQSKDLEVTAINDPAIDIEYICYLIKFDSTHGKFKSAVTFLDDEISIDGSHDPKSNRVTLDQRDINSHLFVYRMFLLHKNFTLHSAEGTTFCTEMMSKSWKTIFNCNNAADYVFYGKARWFCFKISATSPNNQKIKVFCEKLPSKIPWNSANVQYVVEASGMFTSLEKASGHLTSETVKRVIVTAPTVDVPMLILGVNKEQINVEQKVISCASSTLYCLAPIMKILEDNYGVVEGFITSIHAMTPSLKPLDGLCIKGKHWRDHRSIHQNIIPAATGACKALGKIIPSVKDKLTGLAFRVPIVNVSVLDITVRLSKTTSIQDIIKCVEEKSKSTMRNIIKISKDQEVSSDFMGDEHSCIFDINSSLQFNPNFFKLICWYENEYSYACRVMGSIIHSEENSTTLDKNTTILLNHKILSNHSNPRNSILDSKKECNMSKSCTQKCQKILFNTIEKNDLQTSSMSHRQTYSERGLPHRNSTDNQFVLQGNEIFKIWNDKIQISNPLIRGNRNKSFQSCVTLGKPHMQNNNYLKTKEQLKEVNKEFCKMVDTTDLLLAKSKQNSREINNLEEEIENCVEKKEQGLEKTTQPISPTVSKRILTNSVCHTNICKIYNNVFKTKIKENGNILLDKNISENNTGNSNEACKKINQHTKKSSNDIIPNHLLPHRQTYKVDSELNNKKVDAKKVCADLANQQNFRCNLEMCSDATTENNINIKSDSSSHKADLENWNLCKKSFKHDVRMHIENVNNLNNPKNTSDVVLINKTSGIFKQTDKSDINSKELTVTYIKQEPSEDNNKCSNGNVIRNKIKQEILKILTEESLDDKTSPSLDNTHTTISTMDVNKSLDIYDKIDSASGTDSENSFQINERTSQVIDITDLTTSVEDLARLDKICRIIEISDEMSDKLFSVLNNNNQNTRRKKWSFKDLCERIKLDDFCNNVFGRSNYEGEF